MSLARKKLEERKLRLEAEQCLKNLARLDCVFSGRIELPNEYDAIIKCLHEFDCMDSKPFSCVESSESPPDRRKWFLECCCQFLDSFFLPQRAKPEEKIFFYMGIIGGDNWFLMELYNSPESLWEIWSVIGYTEFFFFASNGQLCNVMEEEYTYDFHSWNVFSNSLFR